MSSDRTEHNVADVVVVVETANSETWPKPQPRVSTLSMPISCAVADGPARILFASWRRG